MNPFQATALWLNADVAVPRWLVIIGEACALMIAAEFLVLLTVLVCAYSTKARRE